MSCWHMALCADCNSCRSSSVLSVVAPSLPQYPGLESKFIKPSDILFRSPIQPDCVSTSKVSASVHLRSIDVCRSEFDMATSTGGSIDPMETFGGGSAWLLHADTYPVSRFDFWHLANIEMLDLDLHRFNFDAAMLMPGSVDLPATFRVVSGWLHGMGTSQVSCFAFLRYFSTDMLDLELYRCDLDPTASPSPSNKSNDSVRTFRGVFGWLRCVSASMVSLFDFGHLANIYRFRFDSSTSTAVSDESVRTFCRLDRWLGRHR